MFNLLQVVVVEIIAVDSRPYHIAIAVILSPQDKVRNIIVKISKFVLDGKLKEEKANGLIAKLYNVIIKIDEGKLKPAVNQINPFINQVKGFIVARKISQAYGNELIDDANAGIGELS